ncbi:MAG: TolC family outer membrane protein [Proteobacteria bacterium]|nr:TolC family outer membrane protein [Pseudomonadota bacterium]
MAAAAPEVSALGLLDAWQAARQADPEYRAAMAAHDAGGARRDQAAALWRPTLQLAAGAGVADTRTSTRGAQFTAPGFGTSDGVDFDTSVNHGGSTRIALEARQPLLSRARDAQQRQLQLAADAADLQWLSAGQALMLRTAERYFDVVTARESLSVMQRQQTQVEQSAAEAKDRFRIGDAPVTDTHEAAARREAVRAEVLAAETRLEVARHALADLTGLTAPEPEQLADGAADAPLAPLADWLADARAGNLLLRLQAAGVASARQEAARYARLASPTLDLVAQVGRDRVEGHGDFGSAADTRNNASIGVQFTVPLYTGGMRDARERETLGLAAQAAAEADRAGQQVAEQTHAAWLALSAGAGRVSALRASVKAAEARLDATRLGREVGDRTTLDLLAAENDAASAELALLQARVQRVLDRLRLAALAGRLDEAALRQADAMLRPAGAVHSRP